MLGPFLIVTPRTAARIAAIADVRLRQHFAECAVGEVLGRRRRDQIERGGDQAARRVMGESLAELSVGVAARQRIAEQVIGAGKTLHGVAAAGRDTGQASGRGV